jgi:hypothetical protein
MNFQLTPFNPTLLAQQFADLAADSAFANVTSREFNRIKHEDGRLFVINNGQELMRTDKLHVVIAAFQHANSGGSEYSISPAHDGVSEGHSQRVNVSSDSGFNKARRQWYAGSWSPNQEAGKKPDCQSFDGVAPDAGVASPQSAACASCPHSSKGADGYTACSYRKNFLFFLVKIDPQTGAAVVDTETPYVFDASSKSMYTEFEQTTGSGGTHRLIPMLRKMGVVTVEGLVFEMGFHQGSKAPVFKPVAGLPREVVVEVMAAAKKDDTRALLGPINAKPAAPALAAPAQQTAPQLQAPVQQVVQQQVPVQQVVQQPQQAWAPQVQQQVPVQQAAPEVVAQTQQAWAPQVQQQAPVQQAPMQQAAPQPDPAPQVQQQAPVQQAAPVAQAAPAGNRAKALGAFSSLIGSK